MTDAKKRFLMKQTRNMRNLKELCGHSVIPQTWEHSTYIDPDGEIHEVLAIEIETGEFYRTEVKAFIEAFKDYEECFPTMEERPSITINAERSKRGNAYITFSIN